MEQAGQAALAAGSGRAAAAAIARSAAAAGRSLPAAVEAGAQAAAASDAGSDGGGAAAVSSGAGAEETEAPAGTLGIHRSSIRNGRFTVLRELEDSQWPLASASVFSAEESAVVRSAKAWACKATLNEQEWDIEVRGVPASTTVASKTVLFLHGLGQDRSCAFWAKFWRAFHDAGYHILTLDNPGHGRSSQRSLPARGAQDDDLLLFVIAAFTDAQPGQVTCVADAGGASAFVRAMVKQPALFAGHHVLTNPIIGNLPTNCKSVMERHGLDMTVYLADGWGKTDAPFTIASCAKIFELGEEAPDRVNMVILIVPEPGPIKSPNLVAMRDNDFLFGASARTSDVSRAPTFYCLLPSEACVQEVCDYIDGPRRAPVMEQGGPSSGPQKTALEMGEVNENFRVFVRVRPMLRRERDLASNSCVHIEDVQGFPRDPPPQRIRIEVTNDDDTGMFKHHNQKGEFVFDRVFEPGDQREIFDMVAAPLVSAVLQGTNVTMFAYGQTGTGKTYTMEGPAGEEGLTYHSVHMLFANLDPTQCVHFQYVQLYNAEWRDLLDPEAQRSLDVEEGRHFMKIRGATIQQASTPEQMLAAVARGARFRASGRTNMNDASSRSHAVLCVMVAATGAEPDDGAAMYLVDLAGSERVARSGVEVGSQGFQEATAINNALFTLGHVVVSLVEKGGKRGKHIPYANSELTMLLKSGLGGKSKTALICCITAAEDSLSESINTLRFALQASHVKNQVDENQKKADQAAAAEAIADAGNELVLEEDGTAVCNTAAGDVAVRGDWTGEGPVLVCLHDFGMDGSQFDGLIQELRGSVRVIAPTLQITNEKVADAPLRTILALLDWLGVARSAIIGRDFGAIIAVAFKSAHPTRAGTLVLQNLRQHVTPAEYKAKLKKSPDWEMNQYMDCWMLLGDVPFGPGAVAGARDGLRHKTLKGKIVMLWPHHMKGAHDTRGSNQAAVKNISKEIKRLQVIDSYGFSDADTAGHIRGLLQVA